MPHPTLAITFARVYLVPKVTYGIEFWLHEFKRDASSSDLTDKLTSLILLPIRAAMSLPRSTHRLGLSIDFGIPTLHSVSTINGLRYMVRTLCAEDNDVHPCSQLLKQEALFREQTNNIDPLVIARLIKQQKWTSIGAKVRFLILPVLYQRCLDSKTLRFCSLTKVNEKLCGHPLTYWQLSQHWSDMEAKHFRDLQNIYSLTQWSEQWEKTRRKTQAPLKVVKSLAGLSVAYKHLKNMKVLQAMCKLRHARAQTNFYGERRGLKNTASNYCDYPICREKQLTDDADHLLVHCPRTEPLRKKLLQFLDSKMIQLNLEDLTMALMLGEVPVSIVLKARQHPSINFRLKLWSRGLAQFYHQLMQIVEI